MAMDFWGSMAAGANMGGAPGFGGGQGGGQQGPAMKQNKDPLDPAYDKWQPVSYAGGQAGTPWGNFWNSMNGGRPQYYQNDSTGKRMSPQDYMRMQAQNRADSYEMQNIVQGQGPTAPGSNSGWGELPSYQDWTQERAYMKGY